MGQRKHPMQDWFGTGGGRACRWEVVVPNRGVVFAGHCVVLSKCPLGVL